MADVACVELAAWDGEGLPAGGASHRRLALVGSLRRHPRPRLLLALAASIGGHEVRELVRDDDAGTAAAAAGEDACLKLADPDEHGWSEVLDGAGISIAHVLVTVLRYHAADGLRLRRIPRRLVVLERDDERRRFREVDRVRLGSECLLLVADSFVPQVEMALTEAARPGWTRHEAGGVAGVPEGWRLYAGVEIVGIAGGKHIDLSPLIPIAWTQLTVHGGLALPGRRTWLASSPPEVSASSLAGKPALAVLVPESSVEDGLDRAEPLQEDDAGDVPGDLSGLGPGIRVLGKVAPAAIFDLAELEPAPGSYRVTLLPDGDRDGAPLGSMRLRLRAAEAQETVADPLAHPLGQASLAALSAQLEESGVRGAIVPEQMVDRSTAVDVPTLPAVLDRWMPELRDAEVSTAPEASPRPPVRALTCMETGAHYFKLPPTSETRGQAELHGVCEHCGVERFFPARPPRRWDGGRRGGREARLAHTAAMPLLPERREHADAVDLGRLLEALCVLGSGEWRIVEHIAEQMDDRPWAALDAARALSALGHLDLMLDSRDLRPARWSVAPPALVECPEGPFLAGWRSEQLLEALEREASFRGATVTRQDATDGLAVVRIGELEPGELQGLAEAVSHGAGRSIEVSFDAARRLAVQLPSLPVLRDGLRAVDAPLSHDVELFDPVTGGWERPPLGLVPGGYRSVALPRRLWHFNGRDWRIADNRLVKWMAAGRHPPLAFNEDHRTLACHIGGQLPGLYERAAVLGSGRLPTTTTSGHVVYSAVRPGVARALASRLTLSRTVLEVI